MEGMKYIKLFENFRDIDLFCKKYVIGNYSIGSDGSVDVDGDFWFNSKKLEKLPIRFGRVSGWFNCSYNQLTSLEGSPKEVGGSFDCSENRLTSLEGCPQRVGGNFKCYNSKLTSLEGCPKEVGGHFVCYSNKLQ